VEATSGTTSPRERRLFFALFAAVALIATVGCGPAGEVPAAATGESESEPAGSDRPDPLTVIGTYPEEDWAWADAYLAGYRDGTLAEVQAVAERLASESPDRWQPFWLIGLCANDLGLKSEAGDAYASALELAREAGDLVGVALAGNGLAWIEVDRGRPREAETLLREAVDAARRTERDDLRGLCLNGLAHVLSEAGKFDGVYELYEEAVAAYERIDAVPQARVVRYNIAMTQLELGDVTSSGRTLKRLYEESAADGDELVRVRAAVTLGNVHFARRDYDAAREWYARLPESAVEQRAFSDFNEGRLALRHGDHETARHHLERASSQDQHQILAWLAEAYLARNHYLTGESERGRDLLERVIDEAERGGSPEPVWVASWLLGRGLLEDGDHARAIPRLQQAVDIIEGQGDDLDTFTEGLRFLRERSEPYVDLAAALTAGGVDGRSPDETRAILRTVERTHARALRAALHGRGDEPEATSVPERLQAALDDDEVLLDYVLGEERGVVLAVRSDRFVARGIPGMRELEHALDRYRSALRRPLRSVDARTEPRVDLRRSLDAGLELTRALTGGLEEMLEGVRRIYVVPDANLALLPFAALPLNEEPRFLGERFEVAVLPLAGSTPAWTAERTPMLIGGDPEPDYAGEFPALPLAGLELDLVEKTWGARNVVRLQGARLTVDRLMREPMHELRTLHFATHAVASTADPDGCSVYFSRGERLGLSAILQLRLEASPLVVLSACRTGEGELIPGEGVVGLGWAFLRAGAGGVLVSLWSVEDSATAELMTAFHRGLRDGLDPVAALSGAQRRVAAERFHPAYWAPFVLVLRPEIAS
jgi:CHAT domain-containing protein